MDFAWKDIEFLKFKLGLCPWFQISVYSYFILTKSYWVLDVTIDINRIISADIGSNIEASYQ